MGKALDMRIDDDPHMDVEDISKDYIRGLSSYSRQRGQFFHRAGHFSGMIRNKSGATGVNVSGLRAEKTGRLNQTLEIAFR